MYTRGTYRLPSENGYFARVWLAEEIPPRFKIFSTERSRPCLPSEIHNLHTTRQLCLHTLGHQKSTVAAMVNGYLFARLLTPTFWYV